MNKIKEIKAVLKKYQTTPEYKEKRQFDLYFQGNGDYTVGIYEYKNSLFILTSDGCDKPIEAFNQNVIDEIYKQVCKN